jgi:hypothetical protein
MPKMRLPKGAKMPDVSDFMSGGVMGMAGEFGKEGIKGVTKLASKASQHLPNEFQMLENVIKMAPAEMGPTEKLIELLASMGLKVK